jgi:hypothetical protein
MAQYVPGVTGEQALQELLDVSEDVVAAVIVSGGEPAASTVDQAKAGAAADLAEAMLAYADTLRRDTPVQRLDAHTPEGSVFVVREGERTILAATGPDPVTGLVLHDLRTALRKSAPRRRAKARAS